MFIAGIDAGGTSTKCVIVDQSGKCMIRAEAGPANPQLVGFKQAVESVKESLNRACTGIGLDRVDILGIGIAGVGRSEDIKLTRDHLDSFFLAEEVYLSNDGLISLYRALAGENGIVVTAGTGSIVYGLSEMGNLERAGGWGPLLGDEGSGFYLGLEAIKAVIRSSENREANTILTEIIKDELAITDLFELIPFVYQDKLPRHQIARLPPGVLRAVGQGDTVAVEIVNKGIQQLVLQVVELTTRFGNKELTVAVNGGVFKNKLFYNIFKEMLHKYGIYNLRLPVYQSDIGAVLYACAEAGIELKISNSTL